MKTKILLGHQQWQQLRQSPVSPAEKTGALCLWLKTFARIREVRCLLWHENKGLFADNANWQPINTNGSDRPLLERLQQSNGLLDLRELSTVDSPLSRYLAAQQPPHGIALLFNLDNQTTALLLIETTDHDNDWLELLPLILEPPLASSATTNTFAAWFSADPGPAGLCEDNGQLLESNPVLKHLLATTPDPLLPTNHQTLVQSCLKQQRTIEDVESAPGASHYLWTYSPMAGSTVLLRGRNVTDALRQKKAAESALRLYRVITENTTDMISRHSPDGRFLDASPASWALLGYWPETLRGLSSLELFHPDDRHHQYQARNALEEQGYHIMSYRIRHRDGHYLWFETSSRAIRDTYSGSVVEVVSVSRDITERVKTEEKRQRLAEVVDANTDLVLFARPDGQITHANRAARRSLSLNRPPFPPLSTVFRPDDYQLLMDQGWPTALRDGVWPGDATLDTPDGQTIPVSLVLLAHHGASEEHYFSLVMRDMTDRLLRESERRRHQDEMAHSARLITLGELASGIAHEINQPLSAIMNFAAASQRHLASLPGATPAVDRVSRGLEHITLQAEHASEVIRRLRAFLRKGQRRLEPVPVNAVIREALSLCQWELDQHRVQARTELPDGLPDVVADRILLEQVILNLLRNAIDANREQHGTSPSDIAIHTRCQNNQLEITVTDQGPGVDAANRERLFTPFFTSKQDGLGLGLSMSRSVIEGFGGRLDAYPAAAGGLVLHCTLPIHNNNQETP